MQAVIRLQKESTTLKHMLKRIADHGWKEIFQSGGSAEASMSVEAARIGVEAMNNEGQFAAGTFYFQGIKFISNE